MPGRLRGELLRFLLVGGMAVAIDGGSYLVLVQTQSLSPSWAKRLSFVLGSVWAFFMNKHYTFRQREARLAEPFVFTAVYLAGWVFNSVTHDLALGWTGMKTAAFLAATAVSTTTNFIGQKWLVFRRPGPASPPSKNG